MTAIYFPLDPTGKSPANKVTGEAHTLVNRPVRAIVPEYGSFFSTSLVVVDTATGKTLTAQQCRGAEMLAKESAQYGQKISRIVLITDPAVSNDVTITYQALGSWSNYSKKKLDAFIDTLRVDGNGVDKDNILNFPKEWNPLSHLHHASEVYGAEYLNDALNRVGDAASIGSAPNRARVVDYLTSCAKKADDAIAGGTAQLMAEHKANTNAHPQYAKAVDLVFTAPLVKAPFPVTPAANAKDVRLEVTFVASEYYSLYGVKQNGGELHVSTKADFSDTVFRGMNGGVSANFKPTELLPGSKVLYWRVRYRDEEGQWSLWSPTGTFTTVPPYPPQGTFIREYCVGVDKHWIVADGWGGETDILKEAKSTDCGYIPPLPPGTIIRKFCKEGLRPGYLWDEWHEVADGNYGSKEMLFKANSDYCGYVAPIPEGTVKRYYCKGVDQWKEVHDGNYGTYDIIHQTNSITCGYIPPPVAGTVLKEYCKGVDLWRDLADGQGGFVSVLHEKNNSSKCGYVPPPAEGTVLSRRCVGFTRYDTIADGKGGSNEVIGETNSPYCGYVPPSYPPKGEIIGYVCQGFDKYNKVADGQGGFTTVLAERNALVCGYQHPPRGQFIREFCKSVDMWREYHDGSGGTYEELYARNVISCGYVPPPPQKVLRPMWLMPAETVITDRLGTTGFVLHHPEWYYGNTPGVVDKTEFVIHNSQGQAIAANTLVGMVQTLNFHSNTFANHQNFAIYARWHSRDDGWGEWSSAYGFRTNWADSPAYGTFLRAWCDGTTLMAVRSDGNYGEYNTVEQYNSPECGWVNPFDIAGIGALPRYVNAYRSYVTAMAFLIMWPDGTYRVQADAGEPARDVWEGRWAVHPVDQYDVYYEFQAVRYDGSGTYYADGTPEREWSSLANRQYGFSVGVEDTTAGTGWFTPTEVIVHIKLRHRPTGTLNEFSVTFNVNGECFAVGTLLRTPDGDKAVEAFVRDDIVTSFSEPSMIDTQQANWEDWKIDSGGDISTQELSKVTQAYRFVSDTSVKINGLHTTLNHRHFVFDGKQYGWKKAQDITLSDAFVDSELGLVPVTTIEPIDVPHEFVHLNVEDLDTLQVRYGDKYILTHNAS